MTNLEKAAKMTKVYKIRHAEAEGNLYRRAHGWYNSFLTDTGWIQVKYKKKRFKNISFNVLIQFEFRRFVESNFWIILFRHIQ